MMRSKTLFGAIAFLAASTLLAVPTTITVRVIAKGAKFVGSGVGGALIIFRDADTGEILASGVTSGGTGDTDRIMKLPRRRDGVLASGGAAAFTTTLDLAAPERIEVSAFGPLADRGSANRVSATQWVLPGRDITAGDAWLLELPGFAVQVTAPAVHATVAKVPADIRLAANVTMMCGCHLEPGGLWDSARMQIAASVTRNGRYWREVPLAYDGTPSRFAATLHVTEPGTYEAVVSAYDPANGNTGLDTVTFVVANP